MSNKPIVNKVSAQAENIAFQVNKALDTLAEAISERYMEDGSFPILGDVDMNNYKIRNLGDATDDYDAVNLKRFKDLSITELPDLESNTLSEEDLDTVIEPGLYKILFSCTNKPVDKSGYLLVITGNNPGFGTAQVYITDISNEVYTRLNNSVNDTPWKLVTGDANLYLSNYVSLNDAISSASALGKSLIIDQPVDLGGATVDCLGVPLVWYSSGNVISNGTLNNLTISQAGRYKIIDTDVTISTVNTNYINSLWLGVTGDETTDDSVALTNCFNWLNASSYESAVEGLGSTLEIPWGDCLFGTTLNWSASDTKLICGATLKWTGTGAGVAINISKTGEGIQRLNGNIKLVDDNGSDWGTQKTGVYIDGVKDSNIVFDKVGGQGGSGDGGFFRGIDIDCVEAGTYYNKFYLGTITENKIGIRIIRTSGSPHGVNANNFFGGHFTAYSGHTSGEYSDSWHIYIDGVDYGNNGNTFYSPSFEQSDYFGYFYCGGDFNSLIAPRIEGSPNYRVLFSSGANYNLFISGGSSLVPFMPEYGYSDVGTGNQYTHSKGSKWGDIHRYENASGVPGVGTFKVGDRIKTNTTEFVCTSAGTDRTGAAVGDSSGVTTSGSPVITLGDASDFKIGYIVNADSGFPAGNRLLVIDIDGNDITVDQNATSSQTGVSVATTDPSFIDTAGVGINQTWQDKSSSRSLSTYYTNNTGRPIFVSVTVEESSIGSGGGATLYVAGTTVAKQSTPSSGTGFTGKDTVTAIVPNGVNYRVDPTLGSTLLQWWELTD